VLILTFGGWLQGEVGVKLGLVGGFGIIYGKGRLIPFFGKGLFPN